MLTEVPQGWYYNSVLQVKILKCDKIKWFEQTWTIELSQEAVLPPSQIRSPSDVILQFLLFPEKLLAYEVLFMTIGDVFSGDWKLW